MSGKVAPLPLDTTSIGNGELGSGKRERRSRVFKAVNDAYEFDGWSRIWLAVVWFVVATTTVSYRFPVIAGTYHSTVKALMTSYETTDGAVLDVRSQRSFLGGLTHALGFLTNYADKADAAGHPDGMLPITEYDRILFARLVVDFKSNCDPAQKKAGFSCYRSRLDPVTGGQLGEEEVARLAGENGFRRIELLNPNVTREELRIRVQQVLDEEMMFISLYGFRASLEIGVTNTLAARFATVYLFTVSRKSYDAIGAQSMRSVVTLIDNVNLRDTPMYICSDDYGRAVMEVISLLFLIGAVWDEVVQFQMVRAWRNLHLTDEARRQPGTAAKRTLHLLWFFFAQPWNALDFIAIANFFAWWITYVILLAWSFRLKVDTVRSLAHFDAIRPFADWEQRHVVWGNFTAVLVGLRVLPFFKTQSGISIYLSTLGLSWQRLKDLACFFGYVFFLLIALIEPLFEITGANPLFRDTGTGILNTALMTFQYLGFPDYFSNNAPTFGAYWLIFMFFFWVVVLFSVVILQNVLLALVASAYDESREMAGEAEFTQIQMSMYRLSYFVYSRWHRLLLRKSSYALAEELMAATSRPDVSSFKRVFVRWALANLPEMRLLSHLYTDPASEILYLYSPWAWHRKSPWDLAQQAPWDEQLDYPMYSWEDVPMNESNVGPRLRRMPPLFTRNPPEGRVAARGRLPVSYSEADDLFAMSEEEVDALLEAAGLCWERMARYPVVGRFAGLGWSRRGVQLVREGLLEVYRRHSIRECTTTSVDDVSPGGSGSGGGALVATGEAAALAVKSATGGATPSTSSQAPLLLQQQPSAAQVDSSAAAGAAPDTSDAAATAAATAMQRNRQFSLFNRRGRIAENLDLLWGEVSELRVQQAAMRQQQAEIHALLQALVQQQQQRGPASDGAGGGMGGGLGSRGGGGGGSGGAAVARGSATLVLERPASDLAPRSRGPWGE